MIDLTKPAKSTRQVAWTQIEERSNKVAYKAIEPKVGSVINIKGNVQYKRGDKIPGYILALGRYCEGKGKV